MLLVNKMINWLIANFDSIANWCSILGLLISLFVLYSLKKIRKHFKLKARIPEIVNQLEDFSKELNSYIDDIEGNKNELIIISKRLEYTLKSLREKSTDQITKNIDKMLVSISMLKKGGPFKWNPLRKSTWKFDDEIWEIYSDIQGILQGLKEANKDSLWSEQ